jgi:hypothetical protein
MMKNKTYASATEPTPEDLKLMVFMSEHSWIPIPQPVYQALRAQLIRTLAATALAQQAAQLPQQRVVIDILPLDREHRGMPILPKDMSSQRWTVNAISNITLKDTDNDQTLRFRAWRKGEMPQEYTMQLYLPEDHDKLSQAQVVELLVYYNDDLPTDYRITSYQQQLDRNGVEKGRLFQIKAGDNFHSYCMTRSYKLTFPGGRVECITTEAKTKQAINRKRAGNTNNNDPSRRDNNNGNKPGPGSGPGTKKQR